MNKNKKTKTHQLSELETSLSSHEMILKNSAYVIIDDMILKCRIHVMEDGWKQTRGQGS